MKSLILLTVVALIVAAFAAGRASAATPSPRQAARATKACFLRFHWAARLSDGGFVVDAKAPRKLAAYPYRPWYSVAFNRGLAPIEIRLKLNRRENRTASFCRRAAWR